jgi:hypothetical protein
MAHPEVCRGLALEFVVGMQVGTVQEPWGGPNPGDFDCYKRAENMPAAPNCPQSARTTLLADAQKPASEFASETAAGLAAAAALLQIDHPTFAKLAITSARAAMDFATQYPGTAVDREKIVKRTYATTVPKLHWMWGNSILAWAHNCNNTQYATCSPTYSQQYQAAAEALWKQSDVRSLPIGGLWSFLRPEPVRNVERLRLALCKLQDF